MSTHVALPINGGFAGYTPGSIAVAAGNYGQEQTGDVAVVITPLSPTSFNRNFFLNGAVIVAATPNAGLVYSDVHVLAGGLTIGITPEAALTNSFGINGSVSVQTSIVSEMVYAIYVDIYTLIGDTRVAMAILSAIEYDPYAGISTTIDVDTGSISAVVYSAYGSINPTVDVNSGSIGAT